MKNRSMQNRLRYDLLPQVDDDEDTMLSKIVSGFADKEKERKINKVFESINEHCSKIDLTTNLYPERFL